MMNPHRRQFLEVALAGASGLAMANLAGCASTGNNGTLAPSGSFHLAADDGTKLFIRRWTDVSGTPKGVVQIAHGAAEHSARYARFAAFLNANGYLVYADDHRGHGNTRVRSGALGDAGPDAWNNFMKDQANITDHLRREHPGLRLVLFGHSMGSLMAQDYLWRYGKRVDAVALSATFGGLPGADELMVVANKAVAEGALKPSQLLADIFASFNMPFTGKPGFDWLSRDAAEVQKYVNDPFCGFAFSTELARDMLGGMINTWKPENESRVPKDMPLFVIAGDQDPVGGNTLAITPLLERYKKFGMNRVQHRFYAGARHEILNETNYVEVQRDILKWLNSL